MVPPFRLPSHQRVRHEAGPGRETAFIDPFRKHKTLDVAFSIVDPLTDEPYSRDPRQVAGKAEAYLKSTGIADTAPSLLRPSSSSSTRSASRTA